MQNLSSWNSTFLTRACALALLLSFAGAAHAKAPAKRAGFENAPRSITPKPKEWAMDDDPIAPPPPHRPATPPAAPGQPQAHASAPGAPAARMPNVESAPGTASLESLPVATVRPQRQLPFFLLVVTALLSMGALAMCATLILRDEAAPAEEVPVVPDALEVNA
jgi:hypothetical protein